MTSSERPAQRPEGRLIQTAMRLRKAPELAALAGISPKRWRDIVNGYQPVVAGEFIPVTAPPATLARMARVVGVTPDQLEQAGRQDAAEEMRALDDLDSQRPAPRPDTPPLPDDLDDLIAIYLSADPDEQEVILGQVRWLLRALRPARADRVR